MDRGTLVVQQIFILYIARLNNTIAAIAVRMFAWRLALARLATCMYGVVADHEERRGVAYGKVTEAVVLVDTAPRLG